MGNKIFLFVIFKGNSLKQIKPTFLEGEISPALNALHTLF